MSWINSAVNRSRWSSWRRISVSRRTSQCIQLCL